MRTGGWLVAMLWVVACRGDTAPPPDDLLPPDDATIDRPAEPASLADVAPTDTAGILALIREEVRASDALANTLVSRDTLLDAPPATEPRQLRLWLQDGRPVKLVATEPNTTDRVAPQTFTWFRGGEIAVAQLRGGMFLFAGDGIVFTADEALVPIELDQPLRDALEREVLDSVRSRLAVFGVGYP